MRSARSLLALASLFAALMATPALAEACSSECCIARGDGDSSHAAGCCEAGRVEPRSADCACRGSEPAQPARSATVAPLGPALALVRAAVIPARPLADAASIAADGFVRGPPPVPLFLLHRVLLI